MGSYNSFHFTYGVVEAKTINVFSCRNLLSRIFQSIKSSDSFSKYEVICLIQQNLDMKGLLKYPVTTYLPF